MTPGSRYRDCVAEVAERASGGCRVVAVSKNQNLEAIYSVYEEGCRDFGENRVQELLDKQERLPKDIRWHFIGTLQLNKVRKLIGRIDCIHSVDSLRLAQKISTCSLEQGGVTSVLLQVNTSGEGSKHGFTESGLEECIGTLVSLPGIEIRGLMTMAPHTDRLAEIRDCFRRLKTLQYSLQDKWPQLSLIELSMGMSHDYLAALEEGATMVRLGERIFGARIL